MHRKGVPLLLLLIRNNLIKGKRGNKYREMQASAHLQHICSNHRDCKTAIKAHQTVWDVSRALLLLGWRGWQVDQKKQPRNGFLKQGFAAEPCSLTTCESEQVKVWNVKWLNGLLPACLLPIFRQAARFSLLALQSCPGVPGWLWCRWGRSWCTCW